jgi:hypothetical protein
MTRTLPALGALAITLSLLVFALLQRTATAAPATSGACLVAAPTLVATSIASARAEVTSCVDETIVASAEASR